MTIERGGCGCYVARQDGVSVHGKTFADAVEGLLRLVWPCKGAHTIKTKTF